MLDGLPIGIYNWGMATTITTTRKGETMTYGLKKTTKANTTLILIKSSPEFVSPRIVGIGGYQHREWKTRKGAERAANQFTGSEVFEITETLNY